MADTFDSVFVQIHYF